MQRIVTDDERRLLRSHFWKVVNSDPMLMNFPRKDRVIFVERMIDVETARIEERPVPQFPPDGYEITFYPKQGRPRPPSLPSETDAPEHETVPNAHAY